MTGERARDLQEGERGEKIRKNTNTVAKEEWKESIFSSIPKVQMDYNDAMICYIYKRNIAVKL